MDLPLCFFCSKENKYIKAKLDMYVAEDKILIIEIPRDHDVGTIYLINRSEIPYKVSKKRLIEIVKIIEEE